MKTKAVLARQREICMSSQKTFTQAITWSSFWGLPSICGLVLCSEILSASKAVVGRLCVPLLEETIGV